MIALPTIGRDLGGSTTALQWVTGAYSLTFGGLLLTAGSIADRFGRRRVLLVGLTLLGGTALSHVRWEWLLVVNAPVALIAVIGVRLGVSVDDRAGLTNDRLDLPGALLSIATIGLACYTATSGVDHGWMSGITWASGVGAVVALVIFVWHELRTKDPMLDLKVFGTGTVRGAAIAQIGTSIAMAGVQLR